VTKNEEGVSMAKIVILGLDGFNPELVKQWSNELPNLMKMQKEGIWGSLKSTVPLTVPQIWTCAQCGQNPGAYGFWDFTYRDDFSYGEAKVVNSEVTRRVDLLYTLLPKKTQRVGIINVPVTWPPPKIPAGYAISGFMTPSLDRGFTYPESLKDEVCKLVGKYIINVTEVDIDCSKIDKGRVLKNIYDMDSQRFLLTRYFINEKNCDYVMSVVMGSDRMLNLFYRCFDSKDEPYDPDPCHKDDLHDYYVWIDNNVGQLRESLAKNVVLFIHSGYGVQKLEGRINLNEWLIKEGYMTLLEYPTKLTSFKDVNVDWSKTKCWSTSYTGKLYLNMNGREPQGIVDPKDYDGFLDELAAKLRDIPNMFGRPLNTQVWKGDDIHFGPYAQYGPDLFVNFDEGRLNTSELLGHGRGDVYSFGTAKGSSDVAHSLYGYFVIAGLGIPAKGELKEVSLLNVAPTVLDVLGLPIPKNMERPSILSMVKKKGTTYSKEAERIVRSRLEALGY
jgi:predicted AlkP superfamily phosphohydrolase/phosphomutase